MSYTDYLVLVGSLQSPELLVTGFMLTKLSKPHGRVDGNFMIFTPTQSTVHLVLKVSNADLAAD